MDILILGLFCIILIGCVILDISTIIALIIGLILFIIHGMIKGFSLKEMLGMCHTGFKTSKNIVFTMLVIGALTAIWRASGCIPAIVCYASGLISPAIFLLIIFLLNGAMSVLTGTSFGTSATMGVICMSIAKSMNFSPLLAGGAILSGVFVGDRCSPLSTSALLVSELTHTKLYDNLKAMVKSTIVPFSATCIIYLVLGFLSNTEGTVLDVRSIFSREFAISPVCLIPAAIIIILSVFKVNVRLTMLISIIAASLIAFFTQHLTVAKIVKTIILGFAASDTELAALVNGGGVFGMINVVLTVGIASCYFGIFEKTGILNFLHEKIEITGKRIGNYATMFLVAILTSMISCNQTLAIMLSEQLSERLNEPKDTRAIIHEDTVVLMAALVPWSIAGNVPISTVGAPMACLFAACYLYLPPLYGLAKDLISRRNTI